MQNIRIQAAIMIAADLAAKVAEVIDFMKRMGLPFPAEAFHEFTRDHYKLSRENSDKLLGVMVKAGIFTQNGDYLENKIAG